MNLPRGTTLIMSVTKCFLHNSYLIASNNGDEAFCSSQTVRKWRKRRLTEGFHHPLSLKVPERFWLRHYI